jgi:hypothetical protein
MRRQAALFFARYYKTRYTIYAATESEYNEGYVWMLCPPLRSRAIIELRNSGTGFTTYCEARHIDQNFLTRYTASERTTVAGGISDPIASLVISEWYRNALGGFDTTFQRRSDGEDDGTTTIKIRRMWLPVWRELRAASHHPDIAVRVGTRLGMLGVWLGLVGVAAMVIDWREPLSRLVPQPVHDFVRLFLTTEKAHSIAFLILGAVSLGFLCWLPCRGPSSPRSLCLWMPSGGRAGTSNDRQPEHKTVELRRGDSLTITLPEPATSGTRSGTRGAHR